MLELVEAPALARAAALHLHDVQLDPALHRYRAVQQVNAMLASDSSESDEGERSGGSDADADADVHGEEQTATARIDPAAVRLRDAAALGLEPMPIIYANVLRALDSAKAATSSSTKAKQQQRKRLRQVLAKGSATMASMHVIGPSMVMRTEAAEGSPSDS